MMTQFMQIMQSSVIYCILARFGTACLQSMNNSFLVRFFLKESNDRVVVKNSVVMKLYEVVRRVLQNIFRALKLNVMMKHSVFRIHFIWALLPVVLAPFLPTMIILAFVLLGFFSLVVRLLMERQFQLQYSAINKYIYLYAFIYFCAIFTSVTVKGSLLGGILMVCFTLFSIVVINAFSTKSQVDALNFLIVGSGLLVSLYGFVQFLLPSYFVSGWLDVDMFGDTFRVYSTLENPNVLGEYLLLIIPIGVACFLLAKERNAQIFYFVSTSCMMLCLILTYSRGCYIGILAAAAVFAVLWDKRFIFLGFLVLLLLPFVLPESIIDRFLSIGDLGDSSTSYRVFIWLGTFDMLRDYWFSGVGPGESAFISIYSFYAYSAITAPHSHNTFLQIMCDTGIMGLIVFILVIYQYFRILFKSYMKHTPKVRNRKERMLTIAGISSMVGFMLQSLFDYTFYNYRVALLFWIFLGLGIVYSKYSTLKDS